MCQFKYERRNCSAILRSIESLTPCCIFFEYFTWTWIVNTEIQTFTIFFLHLSCVAFVSLISQLFLFYLFFMQGELSVQGLHAKQESTPIENAQFTIGEGGDKKSSREDILPNEGLNIQIDECSKETTEPMGSCDGNSFLRRLFSKLWWVVE